MQTTLLAGLIVLAGVTSAAGQTPRLEIGPVVRLDRVFIEGGTTGSTVAAGAAATLRLSNRYAIQGDVTRAARRIERSYEGRFISYATGPAATREEIERLAPVARRSLGYAPGVGASVAFRAGGDITPRVAVGASAGATARRYDQTSAYTLLSIPDGVDPSRVARDHQNSSVHRWRGGLLLGLDGSVAVTPRLSVAPEVRVVYGGPARIGNKYRELGAGLRAVWRF
ncbi:MAG TPA: hypothetical protein VFK57_10375 [Vicinamibacterales bacterium]|nr:hypothetical protein [Vicinamibacterales bacterium]